MAPTVTAWGKHATTFISHNIKIFPADFLTRSVRRGQTHLAGEAEGLGENLPTDPTMI
jgi:hypothetical protein